MRKLFKNNMLNYTILMSASRSVAAAQRRRAGPPEVQAPRGPNTSINSSQAFISQQPDMRPGTTGRLAGQQAAINQKQQMQAQAQQSEISNGQPKMTIPKAITLITLRLGRLEGQMQNLDASSLGQYNENGDLQQPDNVVITNILQRLDALEQKSNDIATCKQQLDVFKPALVTIKNASIGNAKEVKFLKENLEQMKTELSLTKSLVSELQGLLGSDSNLQNEDGDGYINGDANEDVYVDGNDDNSSHIVDNGSSINDSESSAVSNDNLTPTVNLKDMIEQELNASE